ncbi:DUF6270 domain-containing protein [Rheinheimera soli]|uniref:Capsular polysaccharide synthesis protein n=1 Tax=Rheinheimera soli TaxID=443616 RepID=A0ABU1VUB4_9GAMM|nr:DUF6270 domain-containing protein [Rheinheimera soli]MDR7119312.1 hypothetical protein [Rheinheimera soli]
MRLFIYGSCVSRDALEYQQDQFTLVKYVARTSLSAQLSPPLLLPEVIEKLSSKFQKEMMLIDMQKTLLKLIQLHDFDVLLLDLIDERFSIGLFNGARLTLSKEFIDANAGMIRYPEWNRFSEIKFTAWQRGFAELIELIRCKKNPPKIILNKVLFAVNAGTDLDNSTKCTAFMDTEIARNNTYLLKMYEYISANFNDVICLEYPERYFVADLQHKWGLAPFHYVTDLYKETLRKLMSL